VESEGASVEEAIATALAALNVSRDRVTIEVLARASSGLFGMRVRRACVRVTVRDAGAGATVDESGPGTGLVSQETWPETEQRHEPVDAERVIATLRRILDHIGAACTVQLCPTADPGTLTIAVHGAGSAMVIGRQGQTLDAIEHLLNRMAGSPAIRVAVDVEGYRERRHDSLERLAHRLAGKVRDTGRPLELDPMSPRDRRVIHVALQDDRDVTTRSEGVGRARRVIIAPRGRPPDSSAR
jgi:spoIIIJ-associated protein